MLFLFIFEIYALFCLSSGDSAGLISNIRHCTFSLDISVKSGRVLPNSVVVAELSEGSASSAAIEIPDFWNLN